MQPLLCRIVSVFVLVGSALALFSAEPDVPYAPMPDRVFEDLHRTVVTFPFTNPPTGPTDAQLRGTNEIALKVLRQIPWPDFDKLQRVRYHDPRADADTNRFQGRWIVPQLGKQESLLGPDLRRDWDARGRNINLEPVDYRVELAELLEVLGNPRSPRRRIWSWPGFNEFGRGGYPQSGAVLNHVIAAAWVGYTNEARNLFGFVLARDPEASAAWRIAASHAGAAYEVGLKLLREGNARSDVLGTWESALRIFGERLCPPALPEYVTKLREQVEDFPRLQASTLENPDKLPPEMRARYYLDRFPDTAPLAPFTQTQGLQDKVIALGRAAVPALLDRLGDRRLTRLTGDDHYYGPEGRGNEGRTVLRVQDLAMVCVERICDVRFMPSVGDIKIFSSLPEPTRTELAAEAKAWWDLAGTKSAAVGRLARLNALSIDKRVAELDAVEKLDPNATNYIALLKSWLNPPSPYALHSVARALARRGDFSLLPTLRENWRKGFLEDAYFLLTYGTPEDYGLLRDAERKRSLLSPGQDASVFAGVLPALLNVSERNPLPPTNRALVPLLTDGLQFRKTMQHRFAGGALRPCTAADNCMDALVVLTAHNEGYDALAEPILREAAIDRWLRWWNGAGENEFLARYPETRPAFGTPESALPPLDPEKIPPVVHVTAAESPERTRYDVPRADVLRLLEEKAVQVQRAGDVTLFRFSSPAAEMNWFKQARVFSFDAMDEFKALPEPRQPAVQSRLKELADVRFTNCPAMHLSNCELIAPDSRGRTWVCWGGDVARVGVLADDSWQNILTEANTNAAYRFAKKFRLALPLNDGAMLLVSDKRLLLFHNQDSWESDTVDEFLSNHARPLARFVPEFTEQRPSAFGDRFSLVLAKDSHGNVWWHDAERLGVMTPSKQWLIKSKDVALANRRYFLFSWFSPLPQEAGVIVMDLQGSIVEFMLTDHGIFQMRETALPGDRGYPSLGAWPVYYRDGSNRFWAMTRGSIAYNADLQPVATNRHRVLMEDPKHGLWSVALDHSAHCVLYRTGAIGDELSLDLPGLRALCNGDSDDTVWALTSKSLLRIAVRIRKLEVLDEFSVVPPNQARMWLDGRGRVWVSSFGSDAGGWTTASCYVVKR